MNFSPWRIRPRGRRTDHVATAATASSNSKKARPPKGNPPSPPLLQDPVVVPVGGISASTTLSSGIRSAVDRLGLLSDRLGDDARARPSFVPFSSGSRASAAQISVGFASRSDVDTLSGHGDFGIANPTATPISNLDPGLDDGWLIVRHHRTETHLDHLSQNILEAVRRPCSRMPRRCQWNNKSTVRRCFIRARSCGTARAALHNRRRNWTGGVFSVEEVATCQR